LIGENFEILRLRVDLDLRDCTGELLKCLKLDPAWILAFISILLNYLKPSGKIYRNMSRTFLSFSLSVGVLFEPVESSISFVSVLSNCYKSENTLLVFERK